MNSLNFNVAKEYDRLEQRIARTADMLEQIVAGQKGSIKVKYVKKTLFLWLVRQTNGAGTYSVRWAKAVFDEGDKRTWYNGWKPGAVPASVVKKMDPDGKARFRKLDRLVCKVCDLRKELTSKKKRILGTFQSVRQTNDPKLRQLVEDIRILQSEPGVKAGPGIEAGVATEPAVSPAGNPVHIEESVPDTRIEDLAGSGPGCDLKKEPLKTGSKLKYNQGGLSGPESEVERGVIENRTGPAASDDLQECKVLKYGLYFKDDQEGSSCPKSEAEHGISEKNTGPVEEGEAEVFLAEDEEEICLAEDDAFDIGGELFEEDF